jgi:hypothetical protein
MEGRVSGEFIDEVDGDERVYSNGRASVRSTSPPNSRQVPHDWQLPPSSIVPSTRMVRGHGSPFGVG